VADRCISGDCKSDRLLEQLLVLANMEAMNAEFIHMNLPQSERLGHLNQIAIRQMHILTVAPVRQLLGERPDESGA